MTAKYNKYDICIEREVRDENDEVTSYYKVKEDSKKLLSLAFVNADASGTYKGPLIFGKNYDVQLDYSLKDSVIRQNTVDL